MITRQVQHMSLLLEDLLDISRITRGTLQLRMEVVDLAEIVQAAVETARPIIDAKRHDFRAELPSEPVRFVADPLRLAQVLSNLLTNAAKYTDPEGILRLRASCSDEIVSISVVDNGIGLPARGDHEAYSKCFRKWHRAEIILKGDLESGSLSPKDSSNSMGARSRREAQGLGHGSEFIVRLPLRKRKRHPPEASDCINFRAARASTRTYCRRQPRRGGQSR